MYTTGVPTKHDSCCGEHMYVLTLTHVGLTFAYIVHVRGHVKVHVLLLIGSSRAQIPSGAWFVWIKSYQKTLKVGSYCFPARCTALWGQVREMWCAFIRWNALSNAHDPRLGLFPGAQVQLWASFFRPSLPSAMITIAMARVQDIHRWTERPL